MKRVMVFMLAFVAVAFAATATIDGDVMLPKTVTNDLSKAAVISGFAMGDAGVTTTARDIWVGSDFDQDGLKEVIIATYTDGGKAYVYEIDGDNNATLFFETPGFGSTYTSACRDARFGDLDGNGEQELLVSINSTDAAIGGLWAFEYDMVGDSMRAPVQLFSDLVTADRWYVEGFFVDDVDGDGVEEVMFGNNGSASANDLSYIASVDTGTFAENNISMKIEFSHGKPSATFAWGGSPYGAVTADIDGDGHKEVLFAIWDHGAMGIVEADSADNYTMHNYIQTDLTRDDDFAFYDFAPRDLDGDGRDEVYLSMYSGGSLYAITCPEGTELSEMTTADVHTLGANGSSGGVCTQLGDFDRNGKMNIYASGGGSAISVHEYEGGDPTVAANWTKLSNLTADGFDGVFGMRYAEDLDGDGFDEIIGGNSGTTSSALAFAIEMDYEDLDLALTFDDATDAGNWKNWNEASGYTVSNVVDSTLVLSDGGYGFMAKRPIVATEGWVYKLQLDIKTSLWEGANNTLEVSVDGIGNSASYSCINDTDWVTYTFIGVATSDSGYIRIAGAKSGTVDTAFVDNVVWDDKYMDIYPSDDIAAAKAIPDYEWVACSGVVTANTIGAPVFMEDATAGIALYEWDLINDGVAEVGDEIFIVGQRSSYKGLVQIKNISEDYVVLSKDNDVTPTLITAADLDSRDYQSMLVVLEDVDTVGTPAWPTEGNDASLTVKDVNGVEFTLRIDRDGEMDGAVEPDQWPLDLVGVISEYNSPQVMPRTMDDFIMNTTPGDFTILDPADGIVISSLDDTTLADYVMGTDTVKAMFINWSEAADSDDDTVTYELMVSPEGPDEAMTTTDTCFFIPLNEDKPYEMNGIYEAYIVATDLLGATSMSDTITITFDFPKPAEITYATSVITDAGNMVYVEFDMCLDTTTAENAANYSLIGDAVVAPTAAQLIAENAVMLTAPMVEDAVYNLVVSGVLNGDGAMPALDTSMHFVNIIPLSETHPEDAAFTIQSFETGIGNFWVPTGSGSTQGVLTTSTFASSADAAFAGEKSGKLVLLDDPEKEGSYVRLYNGITTSIPSNSTLMIMVKGSGDVEMRLSVKDTGYEQGPWHKVTLCEDDWQVVSFDLVNDEAEGWITGNGSIDGDEVKIEAIHMRSTSNEDVTMYLDEMIARRPLVAANVTFNVNMKQQMALNKFNPVLDYVDVAGSMNSWDGTNYLLTDDNADSIYSVTFSTLPLQTLAFKFRINGSWDDATCEFPSGGDNREYFVKLTGGTKDYWYNDDTLVVEEARVGIPTEFALRQNYPNPFNPTTSIEFDMPSAADVKLVVYDVTGRKVRTLVNGALDEGYKNVVWNGRDDLGNSISTGLYIYRIQAGDFIDVKKMTFLK